ncbi:MAG: ABC transporter substrate-binding protein [Candidatus Zixiibacteriota bacterium]|nr:MAG: ABC transporter substrate-binding protein [candidate division Zixibacteria bacterium]
MIRNKLPNTGFRHFLLSPDKPSYDRQVDSVRDIRPDLILAVGSRATEIAKAHFRETPIVFSSVLYPVLSGYVKSLARPGGNITGASLNIPVDIQFRNFTRIIPGLKNVGLLYSGNTAALIPPSRIVAKQLGLNLIAVEVNDQKMLPAALDSLTTTCDGIWSVADPNLFSPQSTRFILLQAIRRGIPFMGFSRNVVESGALFALDFDYKAVGRQAGKTACRILEGTDPGKIPVTSPDVIWFHYNERTAEHIKVKIPDDLTAIAKEVYR